MTRIRRTNRFIARSSAMLCTSVVAALIIAAVTGGGGRTIEAAGEPLGAGGEFHPLTPTRIYDSREVGGPMATMPEGQGTTIDIGAVGHPGMPVPVDADQDGEDDNVLAVVVNITMITPTDIGYLRAFGTGTEEQLTSVVNFFPGSIVPNTAVLRPGRDGKISLRLVTPGGQGAGDVAVDISGWFSTSRYKTFGSRVQTIVPSRVYDSELAQFGAKTLGARAHVEVPIRGAAEVSEPGTPIVPDSEDVVGALVNVTAVNVFPGSVPTYVSALPTAVPAGQEPATSTVNMLTGQLRSNMAIVPVGPDGAIHFFNLQGEIRLVVDVIGYLSTTNDHASRAGRVVPLVAPFRAFDTREAEFGGQPLGPGQAEDFWFGDFVADVKIAGQPVGAQAGLLGNLTTTNLQRKPEFPWAPVLSYMTAYPSPADGSKAVPNVSNISIGEGDIVPNLVLLRYGTSDMGDNSVRFYNRDGYIDYLLDVYAVVLAD